MCIQKTIKILNFMGIEGKVWDAYCQQGWREDSTGGVNGPNYLLLSTLNITVKHL